MEQSFWAETWHEGEIKFHEGRVNPNLAKYFARLTSAGTVGTEDSHVLVPLCGKAVDLAWLAERVGHVTGVEFVEQACLEFFEDNDLTPERVEHASGIEFRSGNLTMLCADVFAVGSLPDGVVPAVNFIWDRAALVALAPDRRGPYGEALRDLAPNATMLLNAFDYDQSVMDGPPHSVPEDEVRRIYGDANVELLAADDVVDRMAFRGHDYFISSSYLITL